MHTVPIQVFRSAADWNVYVYDLLIKIRSFDQIPPEIGIWSHLLRTIIGSTAPDRSWIPECRFIVSEGIVCGIEIKVAVKQGVSLIREGGRVRLLQYGYNMSGKYSTISCDAREQTRSVDFLEDLISTLQSEHW
jgi:hypothetical protein